MKFLTILFAVSSTLVLAEKPGPDILVQNPPLTWQRCTGPGHCTTQHGNIVLRDTHLELQHGGTLESYGVSTNGSALRMNLANHHSYSRFFLVCPDHRYVSFKLLGQEFTFDVDMSTVPCAVNAAIFAVDMELNGAASKDPSKLGARYGTGYCDAQCPGGKSGCCDEMDFWEANAEATAMTPHPCSNGTCDSPGCGYNPYHYDHNYYGPGKAVDTNKLMTVVTQFITVDGTPNTDLKEIKRIYLQNGKIVSQSSKVTNVLTEASCQNAKGFISNGGIKKMSAALKKGMVLAYQLWDDDVTNMTWLDAGNNGPCTTAHVDLKAKYPNAYVVFSNIKVGPIGSTYTH